MSTKLYYINEFSLITNINIDILKDWNQTLILKPFAISKDKRWLYTDDQITEALKINESIKKEKVDNDETIQYITTLTKMYMPKLSLEQKNICNEFIRRLIMTTNINNNKIQDIVYKDIETGKKYSAFERGLLELKNKCYLLGLFEEWDKIEYKFRQNKNIIINNNEFIRSIFPKERYVLDKISCDILD